jgi:hypothetical protein
MWSVGPTPNWVAAVAGPSDPNFATAHASGGLAYDVIESQRRVVDGDDWTYSRVVVRVLSDQGAETVGQQTFEFSPPNERLVLHDVRVHREGESLERLETKNVQLLQREVNLEHQIYNNRRTAFVLIPDLRVGDVLEYSWSVVGTNPVMDGHVVIGMSMQSSHALGVSSARVLSDRPLQTKAFGEAPQPTLTRRGRLYEYTMRADGVAAATTVESVPVEEPLYGWVQFTDFADWKSVAQWGMGLFEGPISPSEHIGDVLAELDLQDAPKKTRVLEVLNWVQRNVRYFATPFAESTHRPTPPGTVLERRYGDCKDVALLTVTLLRAVGIPAQVALVDATRGRAIPELLPSPYAFDHAVVVAFPEGSPVWLDPTRAEQHGPLKFVAARGLRWGLPLAQDVTRLVAVEEPPREGPDVLVEANYTIDAYDEPATLTVRAQYYGDRAHALRDLHANRDEAGFAETFEHAIEKDLRTAHSTAVATGPLSFEDNPAAGMIELSRTYSIPELWSDINGTREFTVRPFSLYGTLTDADAGREHPLALPFPEYRKHVALLTMPEVFAIDFDGVRIDTGPLFFNHTASAAEDRVELEWTVASREARVEVAEFPEYRTALETINENLGFVLYSTPSAKGSLGDLSFNWSIFAVAVMWTVCLLGGALLIIKRSPYIRRDHIPFDATLVGIGDWLALVCLALIGSVIRFSFDLYELLPTYSMETWVALTTPGTDTYEAFWAPVLLFELLTSLLLLALAGLALYTLLKRHRSFPIVFIALHVCAFGIPALHHWLVRDIPSAELLEPREFIGKALRAVVWIAYALRSKRVRSRFLPPPEHHTQRPQEEEARRASSSGPR